jgi:hypothetical protein
MEFVIPSKYKWRTETIFNIEVKDGNEHEVYSCDQKNKWNEEWLLDSGSMVNLTNIKEGLWKQAETSMTVTVGDGSKVTGILDGKVILKEKNSGKYLNISVTYCPNFRKNILSVKRLQLAGFMVTFDDNKATIEDKKTTLHNEITGRGPPCASFRVPVCFSYSRG